MAGFVGQTAQLVEALIEQCQSSLILRALDEIKVSSHHRPLVSPLRVAVVPWEFLYSGDLSWVAVGRRRRRPREAFG